MKTKILKLSGAFSAVLLFIAFSISLTGCKKEEMPGTNEVFMQNMAFSPSTITIQANATVKWTNKDNMTHNVTSDAGTFASGNINAGDVFMRQFTTVGTFTYQCTLHPGMKGTVVVVAQK